jgi:hypothetical protein
MEIHDAQNYLRIYIFKKEFFISIFVDCREPKKAMQRDMEIHDCREHED